MRPDDDFPDRPSRSTVSGTGMALASLILGILSLCTCGITSLPAMICGFIALGKPAGKGLAIGGLVSSFAGVLVGVVAGIGGYFAYGKIQEADSRRITANNLKQIGLATHSHHDTYYQFPVANRRTPSGEPGLSWRVDLLPYMEQQNLYNAAGLGSRGLPSDTVKPWNSPEYGILNQTSVRSYLYGDEKTGTQTPFRAFDGPETALIGRNGRPQTFASIQDGTSNTILYAESAERVPWPKADEMKFTPSGPLPKLGTRYSGGSMVLMCDGSFRFIRSTMSDSTLRAMITASGGEVVTDDW